MKLKILSRRVSAVLMTVVLSASSVTAYAGTPNVQEHVIQGNNSIKVTLPASIDLSMDGDKFTGSGSVSAEYTDSGNKSDSLRVTVDAEVEYTNSKGGAVKGTVVFGEEGVADWSVDELNSSTSKNITLETPLPADAGSYEGVIDYTIKLREKTEQFFDDEYYATEQYFTYEWYWLDGTLQITGLTDMGLAWVASSVNYTTEYDSPCVDKYTKSAGELIVPSKFMIDGVLYDVKSVYGVGESSDRIIKAVILDGNIKTLAGCFEDCSNLTSIAIPDSVSELRYNCFSGCGSLADVTIPDSVTYLGWGCFRDCRSLKQLDIPSSVTEIDDECFTRSGLVELVVPDSVMSMVNFRNSEDYIDGIFKGCSSLKKVVMPDSVKEVREGCFWGCRSLTDVQLSSNLKYLPKHCFTGCSSLENIQLPTSLQYLDQDCFGGCSSLRSIQIPDTVTRIGGSCFSNCTSLEEVEIPNGITCLDGVFNKCSSLRKVVLPDKLEKLNGSCFCECTSLEEINFPASLKTIGKECFHKCTSLKELNLNGTDCRIDKSCFKSCSSLTSVTMSGIISLGEECFYNCSSLTDVMLSEDVVSLGINCFSSCSKLQNINLSNVKELGTGCFSYCSGLLDCDLSSIAEVPISCFYNCKNLRSLYCPNVVTIGNKAFATAYSNDITIDVVELPKCKIMGDKAFEYWGNITAVNMPVVETIGSDAFNGSRKLKEINLPLSVSMIGNRAFSSVNVVNYDGSETDRSFINMASSNDLLSTSVTWNYSKDASDVKWQDFYTWGLNADSHTAVCRTVLKCSNHMEVPEVVSFDGADYTVVELGDNLFKNQTYLEEIILPDTITKLGDSCFSKTGLKSFAFPQNLTHIDNACFRGTRLTDVVIPNSVSYIGDGVFYDCMFLKSVVFPDSITQIGAAVCCRCTALESVTLPSGLTSLGTWLNISSPSTSEYYSTPNGTFSSCSELPEITLPETLKTIGSSVFYNCDCLQDVYLPDSVESIGYSLFESCSGLESVHFPSALEEIPASTFRSCTSLSSLNGISNIKKLGDSAFHSCPYTGISFENISEIGNYAFQNSAYTDFVAGESLKSIGREAFANCKNLESVDLSRFRGSLNGSFYNCTSLKTLKLPSQVTYLYAFYGCSNVENVYCDYTYAYKNEQISGLEYIPESAVWHYGDIDICLYRYFNWLNNTVCNGLKYEIADDKFEILYSYTDNWGNSYDLTSFGADSFKGELRITNLDLPNSVTSIASGAFADCTNIAEVHIPNTMEYIYDNAFSGCIGIQTVYYDGTKEQFDASKLKATWCEGNGALKNADWVFTDGANNFSLREAEIDLTEYEEMLLEKETVLYSKRNTGSEVVEKLEIDFPVYVISLEKTDNGIWYEVYALGMKHGWIFIESSEEGVSDEPKENSEEETTSEVVIEEGGEDIPEETETEIPEVQIEAEVKDEEEE